MYCQTQYFHCILISQFFLVENWLHFNLVYFPGFDILCRQSYGNGRIPEIHMHLIARVWSNRENHENLMNMKYRCFTRYAKSLTYVVGLKMNHIPA